MYKKIIFTLMLCCIMISCGKKGDPVYKDLKKKAAIQSVSLNKA